MKKFFDANVCIADALLGKARPGDHLNDD